MIRKNSKNLIEWIYEYVIDFTAESDTSGLTWNSTPDDAKKFLHSIPQKERVQEYGFYSTNSHFILIIDFDDIEVCLKNGSLSKRSCSSIYRWNSEKGRDNWNMDDVKEVLSPKIVEYKSSEQNYLSDTLTQLFELGLIKRINLEVKTELDLRVTEKGKRILEGSNLYDFN